MIHQTSTLDEITVALLAEPEDSALIFEVDGQDIRAGYHVTELGVAEVNAIDCGGRKRHWREAHLQLLDGPANAPTAQEHMSVGKFRDIVTKATRGLGLGGDFPVTVDFGLGNGPMLAHDISTVKRSTSGDVRVSLTPRQAMCLPIQEARSGSCSPQHCCA